MADNPIGNYTPITSILPGRDRSTRHDKVYDPVTKKKGGGEKRDDQDASGKKSTRKSEGHETFHDDISVLGIPREEMSEHVRDALKVLLEEISFLRAELSRAHGHEAYLEEQAEKDHTLHVMRRRAFLSRLMMCVRRAKDEEIRFAFLYVPIKNAALVRSDFGHGAAEALMVQAAGAIREGVEAGDIIGTLESYDFGLILPGNTIEEAVAKGKALMQSLDGRELVWQTDTLGITAEFGVTEIHEQDSIEEILSRARRNLDGREKETQKP